jgi:hypothetical protein
MIQTLLTSFLTLLDAYKCILCFRIGLDSSAETETRCVRVVYIGLCIAGNSIGGFWGFPSYHHHCRLAAPFPQAVEKNETSPSKCLPGLYSSCVTQRWLLGCETSGLRIDWMAYGPLNGPFSQVEPEFYPKNFVLRPEQHIFFLFLANLLILVGFSGALLIRDLKSTSAISNYCPFHPTRGCAGCPRPPHLARQA